MGARLTIRDGETLVYEGGERRRYSTRPSTIETKFPFGFSIKDAVWMGTIIVTSTIFLIKTDYRITEIEKLQAIAIETNVKVSDFMQQSDLWHTEATGRRFRGGAPIVPLNVHGSRKLFTDPNTDGVVR